MRLKQQLLSAAPFLFLITFSLFASNGLAQKNVFPEINELTTKQELELAITFLGKASKKRKNQRGLKAAKLRYLEGKIEYAKGNYQVAKAVFESIDFSAYPALHNAKTLQLAAVYTELRELSKASNLLQFPQKKSGIYLYQLGLLHLEQHKYAVADSLLGQVLVSDFSPKIQVQALYRLGESKLEQEQFKAADSLLNEARQKAEKRNIQIAHIHIQNQLGRLKYETGNYNAAEKHFQIAFDLARKYMPSGHPYRAKLHHGLGLVYVEMGAYQKAEQQLQAAAPITLAAYGKSPPYAENLSGLEKLYDKLGQYERSLDYALQQKDIYLNAGNLQDYARITNNLSYSYQDLGAYEKAEVLLQDAIRQLEAAQLTKDRYYALLHMNYGILKMEQKAYHQSKPSLEIAQKLIDEIYGKFHPWYAAVINYLAVLYEKLEQYENAEKLYLETEEIDRVTLGEKHPYYVNTLYNISKFYRLRTQDSLATSYFRKANQGQIDLIYNYYSGFDELTRLDYLKETESDFERFYSFVLEHPDLAMEAQNLSLAIKNLALDFSRDQQASLSVLQDSSTAKIYIAWRESKKQLANSYIKSEEELSEAGIDMAALEAKAETLEKALIRTEAFEAQQLNTSKRYTFAELKNKIAPNEAVIDFIRFPYRATDRKTDSVYYAALVSRHDFEQPKLIFLAEEKKLRKMLRSDVRRNTNNYIENPRISQDLYTTVWKPIAEYVEDVERIHIASSGLLHKVTFAALATENGLLLDNHNFIYHGNLRAFIASKSQKKTVAKNNSICLLGGANFDLDSLQLVEFSRNATIEIQPDTVTTISSTVCGIPPFYIDSLRASVNFNYLSGTRKEVNSIRAKFKAANWKSLRLTGKRALEENIKQLEGKNAPGILHLATHGYFFPALKKGRKVSDNGRGRIMAAKNPLLRSGLALSGANYTWKQGKTIAGVEDGILTAYEIANLNLTNTQLAVLSACETALGDVRTSEGVFGLQRAFKMAGVEQLIISLWKVPDQQTTELMILFYENYLKGKSAAQALYEAQQTMREKYKPFYWAAFVLLQ